MNSRHDKLPLADTFWDVVIAGAGPAGAFSAFLLARMGLSVLLLDRSLFPRQKVCGGCVSSAALDLLRRNGAGEILDIIHPAPLRAVQLRSRGESLRIRLAGGVAVSRSEFDGALVKLAQERGAIFQDGMRAELDRKGADGWTVSCRPIRSTGKFSLQARVVVACDGIGGTFLRRHPRFSVREKKGSRIGLGWVGTLESCGALPSGEVEMSVGKEGYVGVVRLGDDRVDVAAAVDPGALRERSPASLLDHVVRESGAEIQLAGIGEELRGTPPLTRRRRRRAAPGLFVAGDSAGYVEPFTGEGIAWALSSASLVSPLVFRAVHTSDPGLEKDWEDLYRRRLLNRGIFCRGLSLLLRYPGVSSGLLKLARRRPRWVEALAGWIHRPLTQGRVH